MILILNKFEALIKIEMVDWAGVFLIGVLIFVWDLIGSNFEPGLVACIVFAMKT